MALRQIREVGDNLLRKKSRPVEVVDDKIRQLMDDMYETMKNADDGIGIAAPQVGVLKRVIVIDLGEEGDGHVYKLVNPVIIKQKGEQVCREGCLSVPGVTGDVIRPKEVVVEALDENGKPIKIKAKDLFAICLSHEIDHLDGVLFIDKATEIFEDDENTEEEKK
ncbi:MAG: peptide deformylase [Clostridia bacterium]|nr:peptide deformylase [Clostridia bacterium]